MEALGRRRERSPVRNMAHALLVITKRLAGPDPCGKLDGSRDVLKELLTDYEWCRNRQVMCEMKKWNRDKTPCHCLYHWACDDGHADRRLRQTCASADGVIRGRPMR